MKTIYGITVYGTVCRYINSQNERRIETIKLPKGQYGRDDKFYLDRTVADKKYNDTINEWLCPDCVGYERHITAVGQDYVILKSTNPDFKDEVIFVSIEQYNLV